MKSSKTEREIRTFTVTKSYACDMMSGQRRRMWAFRALVVFALVLLSWPLPARAQGSDSAIYFFFDETGFGIDQPEFADFFGRRGQVKTFGYPTSRTFQLLGLPTQFFQRIVLQLGPDGEVRPLNLLEPGLLPYTGINGSTFPGPDDRLAEAAPSPEQPNYAAAIVQFVRQTAPDSFEGQPVKFFSTFVGTVSERDAFPSGGDGSLLPLINLEIWGVPISAPARDPNNGDFIYQRFQRGIMHYDASCRCTQGLLLAEYFKALVTGVNLPPDLEQQARGSAFFRQLSMDDPNGVRVPSQLPATDLRQAFARQVAPTALAPLPGSAVAPPETAPTRTRMRMDAHLSESLDALESAEQLAPLNAILESATELSFGELPARARARYTRIERPGAGGPTREIVVSSRLRGLDPKALATVIAHEAKHLEDDLAGADARTAESCFQFETRAFAAQSAVWGGFYGPGGKMPPETELDEELNFWLAVSRRDPAELDRRVRELYARECTIGRAA